MKTLQFHTAQLASEASGFLEKNPLLLVTVLTFIFLSSAFEASRLKPLWHDELFTYYIAQAPTFDSMLHQSSTLDLNPPLVYLLTRISFHIVGINTLAARLPEIVCFLIAMLSIFSFVRARMGVLYAFFAASLLVGSDLFELSIEARPYSLMLAFLCLAMLAWQYATSPASSPARRYSALTILFASLTCMMLSHVFASLALVALVLAEVSRNLRARKPDVAVLAAMIFPLTAAATFLPFLRNHAGGVYPAAFQPSGDTVFTFYTASVDRQLVCLCLTALAVVLFLGRGRLRASRQSNSPSSFSWSFAPHEWVLIVGLFLTPLVLMGTLIATHGAFFPRYGAVEGIGVILLTVALLGRWTTRDRELDSRAALFGSLIALVISSSGFAIPVQIRQGTLIPTIANSEPQLKPCQSCMRIEASGRTLPLVDASGLTFVEMNHNESASALANIYYLTDPVASRQIAHADIFERMPDLIQAFHLAGQSESYSSFTRAHPRFFVLGRYDYPEDWLLRKLQADDAQIQVLGRTDDSYRDKELYEVTLGTTSH